MIRTIKNKLHEISVINDIFMYVCEVLTRISPFLNTQFHFLVSFGKFLNMRHPLTLNEKISTLKLSEYLNNPLIKQCADKYAVREYVDKKGCSDILVPLIKSYDSVDDIEWDKLPDSFVVKWNFGCSYNIICPEKSKLDVTEAIRKLKKWETIDASLRYSEMQYKDVDKKIIVERYLRPKTGILPEDYKIYCLNGEPCFIMICCGRDDKDGPRFYYLNPNWELQREMSWDGMKADKNITFSKPTCLPKLLDSAKKLCEDFPFVRADFYIVDNKVYFGELTFTPSGGVDTGRKKEADVIMGSMLKINR